MNSLLMEINGYRLCDPLQLKGRSSEKFTRRSSNYFEWTMVSEVSPILSLKRMKASLVVPSCGAVVVLAALFKQFFPLLELFIVQNKFASDF